jgi:hypothetical protein
MASSAVSVIGGLLLTTGVTLTACGASEASPTANIPAATIGTPIGASRQVSPSAAGDITTTVARGPLRTSSSAPRASSSSVGKLPACANADLTVWVGARGAGLGHVGLTIVFTNGSHHQCTLYGYPGVAGLDRTGRQVTQALRTLSGYLGGGYTRATVRLTPGGKASALVEGTDNPAGTAATCPVFPRLLVTAPNQTRSHVLAASIQGCSPMEVHPVVAGATGRS